jgi:hypothetical protein
VGTASTLKVVTTRSSFNEQIQELDMVDCRVKVRPTQGNSARICPLIYDSEAWPLSASATSSARTPNARICVAICHKRAFLLA